MQAIVAKFERHSRFLIPLYGSTVSAGFPSPAEDWSDERIDLNDFAIKNPAATFFVRARGDSMLLAGIHDNDVLVVDRSLQPEANKIVIALVEGEFTVKYYRVVNGRHFLEATTPGYPSIVLNGENDIELWGVVTLILHYPK